MGNNIVVRKNDLNNYKFKITTLSPVHIGTGEVYEPTNFVISDNQLHRFNEVLFYKSLSQTDKNSFNNKLNDYMQIIDFYKSKKEEAMKISHFQCDVSSEIQDAYNTKNNKDGSRNKNQFEIETTFKNPNTFRPIIPGSSLKGMLDTALQIYPKKIKDNDIRQNLIISDAILLNGGVEIGRADRKHRNPSKESKKGIYQRIEAIKPDSEFVFTLDTKFTFEEIKSSLKRFHSERKNSRYSETINSFTARVGKNEGKDYVVDDGTKVVNNDGKPVATHFLFNSNTLMDEEFGWIKIELIDENQYKKALEKISIDEDNYYNDLELKQKEVKDKIKKQLEQQKLIEEEKQKRDMEEAELLAKQKALREAKLAAMDPIDLIIDSFDNDPTKVINAMKDGSIENIDEIKILLAKKLKSIMQKDPKQWEKAKQKALNRKEYIESILG